LWVAYRGDHLVGALGVSEAVGGACWIRLAAADDASAPDDVLRALWLQADAVLRAAGVQRVAVLMMRDWIEDTLRAFGFTYVEDIVTLRRYGRALPESRHRPPEIVRIDRDDAPLVQLIDRAAFDAPWQMPPDEIWNGLRISTYSTLVLLDGQPVGYQSTTTHGLNAHLARLAVLPAYQGRGLGAALLRDMLAWFRGRGVLGVTVNTQISNVQSLRLYERYHFHRNGYDLPVWWVALGKGDPPGSPLRDT
jgi:ribosomal protein S18 acetylase RimI-like enzyme